MRHPEPLERVAQRAHPPGTRGWSVGPVGLLRPGWRWPAGLLVCLGGVLVLAEGVWAMFWSGTWLSTDGAHPGLARAWQAGWVAALATALGTLPACLSRAPSERASDAMMGFGAGVMLAASVFSLVVPALDAAAVQGHGPWARAALVGAGIGLGAVLILGLERVMPPASAFASGPLAPEGHSVSPDRLRRVWLFVAAVTLHNLPEGLAMGVAHGGADASAARALATGIAIQDVPEGLVIASALLSAGHGRLLSVGLGALSGVIEPVAALAAAAVMTWSVWLLPWGLALAAGAMLFVIHHEVVPETHRQGHARLATGALMAGFVLMMALDTALA